MSKQAKRDKAEKQAASQAEAIVEKAVKKVRAKAEASDEEKALGQRVKELRDGGMPWWQIGFELGLKGSADNVKQGKTGASQARRLYRLAFGDVPRTQRQRKGPDETLAGVSGKRRRNRNGDEVVKAEPGQPMFSPDTPDEEVLEALLGKAITWDMYVSDRHGKMQYAGTNEAIVNKSKPVRIEILLGTGGDGTEDRVITFREAQDNSVPINLRGVPGPYRSVRLSRIIKVAGHR